jgi:hypothetical protein
MNKIGAIADYIIQSNTMRTNAGNEIWMDSEAVRQTYSISLRTLQRLRDKNILSYSKLRGSGKCIYKRSEIELLLSKHLIPSQEQAAKSKTV